MPDQNGSESSADLERLRTGLAKLELFAGVDADVLDELAPAFRPLDAPVGSDVVREGDSGTDLYFVESGELEALKAVDGGEPVRLGVLAAGDVFGEMALLSGAPRTATVRALEDSRLWVLSREALGTAVRRAPALAKRLREVMRRRQAANALRSLQ